MERYLVEMGRRKRASNGRSIHFCHHHNSSVPPSLRATAPKKGA